MQGSNTHPLFILHVIDEGQSKRTIVDFSLSRLAHQAETVISNYLSNHGFSHSGSDDLQTEDGYAKIIRTLVNNPETEELIWSYSFDGQSSLHFEIKQLHDRVKELQANDPKVLFLTEEEIRQRIYIAVGLNLRLLADNVINPSILGDITMENSDEDTSIKTDYQI